MGSEALLEGAGHLPPSAASPLVRRVRVRVRVIVTNPNPYPTSNPNPNPNPNPNQGASLHRGETSLRRPPLAGARLHSCKWLEAGTALQP